MTSLFSLFLLAANASILPDQIQVVHLRNPGIIPMCYMTKVVRVQDCISLPTVCRGPGNLCYVFTDLNRYSAACNPIVGATYELCE